MNESVDDVESCGRNHRHYAWIEVTEISDRGLLERIDTIVLERWVEVEDREIASIVNHSHSLPTRVQLDNLGHSWTLHSIEITEGAQMSYLNQPLPSY